MTEEKNDIFRKYGAKSQFEGFSYATASMPVVISYFFILQSAASGRLATELSTGGLAWFTDLAAADPYDLLPLISTASMFLIMLQNQSMQAFKPPPIVNVLFGGLALASLYFTTHFPACIFIYWISSNIFTLLFSMASHRPFFIKLMNLPRRLTLVEMEQMTMQGEQERAAKRLGAKASTFVPRKKEQFFFDPRAAATAAAAKQQQQQKVQVQTAQPQKGSPLSSSSGTKKTFSTWTVSSSSSSSTRFVSRVPPRRDCFTSTCSFSPSSLCSSRSSSSATAAEPPTPLPVPAVVRSLFQATI